MAGNAGKPAGCDRRARSVCAQHLSGVAACLCTDGLALALARQSLAAGADQAVPADWRLFFYLPFEHSEDLADQDQSVVLFAALGDANYLDFAERHRAVIAEFGRFPHRNAFLGRSSTAAEQDYLLQPDAGF